MRFVIKYTAGDGCSWHCDVVLPIEYPSAEQLCVDFETAAREALARGWQHPDFVIASYEFRTYDFFREDKTYEAPEILTIDEWFQQAGQT